MTRDSTCNLVIVAHPDDEILGFGATGAKLVAKGEIVQPVILCGNVDARTHRPTDDQLAADIAEANRCVGFSQPVLGSMPNIRMNTLPHVELVQFIEEQIERFRPDRIFTHHPADLNDDHVQVSRACLPAARLFQRRGDVNHTPSVYFMEIPSATDWSYPTGQGVFVPTVYSDIAGFVDKKIEALGCYRNVLRPFPHPRSAEAINALAAYRGAQSGIGYAEAFQVAFQREFS
jgi:LmbE family N-acetylglucosaminyl deacetylase